MDSAAELTFCDCHIDLQMRELRLHRRVQAVPHKVFDLIVLLEEQRHRVVTKDELQQSLWSGQIVSAGTIARTVMRASKVIGNADLIRTVHSIGYSFTGQLDAPAPPLLVPPVSTALRLD
jgi:DNA-binding winged helix-turn-helix (wHTH) protein